MLFSDIQDPEIRAKLELADLRKVRDIELKQSDFTQLPDIQANMSEDQKQAWANYRQALRDIPDLYKSYDEAWPHWPVKPSL